MAAAPTADDNVLKARWWALSEDGKGDLDGMKKLVEENKSFNIDCLDSTGMTALQHASFRGHVELVEFLLEQGADVNSDKHDNKYTALMFGALSGNERIVNILLDAGAKEDAVNSVNKTASEMAAFVSQHHICGVIRNFYPSEKLVKFTVLHGNEKRPRMLPEYKKPFHALMTIYNLHPINVIRELHKTPGFLEESSRMCDLLYRICTELLNPTGTNEPLAIKLHYIYCMVKQTAKSDEFYDDEGKNFIKRLAKGRDSDGFLDQVEQLVRSTLASFPRKDAPHFVPLLTTLNDTKIGEEPHGIVALMDAVNGTRVRNAEDQVCDLCASRQPKQCTRCQKAFYCPPPATCQKIHWPTHKRFCKAPEPIGDI